MENLRLYCTTESEDCQMLDEYEIMERRQWAVSDLATVLDDLTEVEDDSDIRATLADLQSELRVRYGQSHSVIEAKENAERALEERDYWREVI